MLKYTAKTMARKREFSISIVIPSYKSMATLKLCLDSVLNQSTEEPYEVILVDSSDAATQKIIGDNYRTVKLIKLNHRTNPAQARNIGIRHSKGKLIALIDADCVAEKNWLEMVVKTHEKESYLIIGGPVKNYKKENIIGKVIYLIEFSEFLPKSPRRVVSFIPTCNTSYKKEVFNRFGYFPIKMDCSEDVLFHRKIAARGEKILFSPLIKVSHINVKGWQKFYRHLFKIGFWTAIARKRARFLKGSFLLRFRFLIPMLFFYKLSLVIGRNFKWDRKNFLFIVLFSPLVGLAILAWVYGFWKGALSRPKKI